MRINKAELKLYFERKITNFNDAQKHVEQNLEKFPESIERIRIFIISRNILNEIAKDFKIDLFE